MSIHSRRLSIGRLIHFFSFYFQFRSPLLYWLSAIFSSVLLLSSFCFRLIHESFKMSNLLLIFSFTIALVDFYLWDGSTTIMIGWRKSDYDHNHNNSDNAFLGFFSAFSMKYRTSFYSNIQILLYAIGLFRALHTMVLVAVRLFFLFWVCSFPQEIIDNLWSCFFFIFKFD